MQQTWRGGNISLSYSEFQAMITPPKLLVEEPRSQATPAHMKRVTIMSSEESESVSVTNLVCWAPAPLLSHSIPIFVSRDGTLHIWLARYAAAQCTVLTVLPARPITKLSLAGCCPVCRAVNEISRYACPEVSQWQAALSIFKISSPKLN